MRFSRLKTFFVATAFIIISTVSFCYAKSYEEIQQDLQEMKSKLDFRLETKKTVYKYGEPINITAIWFNNSDEKVSPDNPYYTNISVLKIIDESRNRTYDVIMPHPTSTGPYSEAINPDQSITTTINITEGFDLKPGNYQIQVQPAGNLSEAGTIYIQVQE
jgi:hypothetical protein